MVSLIELNEEENGLSILFFMVKSIQFIIFVFASSTQMLAGATSPLECEDSLQIQSSENSSDHSKIFVSKNGKLQIKKEESTRKFWLIVGVLATTAFVTGGVIALLYYCPLFKRLSNDLCDASFEKYAKKVGENHQKRFCRPQGYILNNKDKLEDELNGIEGNFLHAVKVYEIDKKKNQILMNAIGSEEDKATTDKKIALLYTDLKKIDDILFKR